MSKLSGKDAYVAIMSGTTVVTIADQVSWSLGGITTPTVQADAAFSDTCAQFENAGPANPGTITFNGHYDPTDTDGQLAITALCVSGAHATGIRLYDTATSYWTSDTASGGYMLVTDAQAVTLPRNGYGTISFSAQVSHAPLLHVSTST